MAVCPKSMWPAVKAMLHSVYDQPTNRPLTHSTNCTPVAPDPVGTFRNFSPTGPTYRAV